jgi:hypothetical protein
MKELCKFEVEDVAGGAWWHAPAAIGFVWGFLVTRL